MPLLHDLHFTFTPTPLTLDGLQILFTTSSTPHASHLIVVMQCMPSIITHAMLQFCLFVVVTTDPMDAPTPVAASVHCKVQNASVLCPFV
jgi:hypothetical protein